jgi:hypothetical protein
MKMRIRAWLLRRLLGLKADTDVAIVSVLGHEPIVTHGTYVRPTHRVGEWPYSERVH